eukprot:5472601-Pleurochrysis_carterae.AAC.1
MRQQLQHKTKGAQTTRCHHCTHKPHIRGQPLRVPGRAPLACRRAVVDCKHLQQRLTAASHINRASPDPRVQGRAGGQK